MNLMIFGPPGSGKGTYGSRLEPVFNIKRISTGEIFRDEVKKKTELGKKAEEYLNRGELVPDNVVIDMLKKRLEELGNKNFILDGFPRTIDQAKALDKIVKIDAIINIIAPEEILIEKATARRICSNTKCDGNYNIANIKKVIDGVDYILPPLLPKKTGACDKCTSKLYQRVEDADVKIIKKRLKVYEDQSKPVLTHYTGKIKLVEVHMNRPPNVVVDNITKQIKKLGLK
jgi:adenylate kinase